MPAKRLMIFGAVIGVLAILAAFLDGPTFALLAFGAGAIFGKGYGVLEERGQI